MTITTTLTTMAVQSARYVAGAGAEDSEVAQFAHRLVRDALAKGLPADPIAWSEELDRLAANSVQADRDAWWDANRPRA